MNWSGMMVPRFGWDQRTRASNPAMAPVLQ
jgi:hypothetical protein